MSPRGQFSAPIPGLTGVTGLVGLVGTITGLVGRVGLSCLPLQEDVWTLNSIFPKISAESRPINTIELSLSPRGRISARMRFLRLNVFFESP